MRRTDVYVWLLPVDGEGAFALSACWTRLSAEERERAERLTDDDRGRFVAARGALRHLLGAALGVPGADVPLRSAPGRPPRLDAGPRDLAFSVAHAGDRVACALARRPVGVDVEPRGAAVDDLLVARTCSPAERRMLDAIDEAERAATFLRLWVRKEAVGKALGTGMPPRPGDLDVRRRRAAGVTVRDLRADASHVAAVAAAGTWWRTRLNPRPPAFSG